VSLLLRLHLEVDGDVHPELYTLLASLPLESSQAERLRQLAATGLIWEQLRAQARRRPANASPASAAARPQAEIPVLREVVPAGELVRLREAMTRRGVEASTAREISDVAANGAPPSIVEPIIEAAIPAPVSQAADSPAPGRTHGRRSRLLRMKEKGLFGNG